MTIHVPTSATRVVGDDEGGTVANLGACDDAYMVTGETATGLEVQVVCAASTVRELPDHLLVCGSYRGTAGHAVAIAAWNYQTSVWDTIGTMTNRTEDYDYECALSVAHQHPTTGEMRLRFLHNVATYNTAHFLTLNRVWWVKRARVWDDVLEGALTAAEIVRLMLATLAGPASLSPGPGAFTFRDQADAKDRVAGLVATDGSRTITTVDGT